jgi:hypothetical protein
MVSAEIIFCTLFRGLWRPTPSVDSSCLKPGNGARDWRAERSIYLPDFQTASSQETKDDHENMKIVAQTNMDTVG